MSDCWHEETVPVVSAGSTAEHVARLCLRCDAQLSAAWGCPRCEWESDEVRTLGGDVTVHHILARRCVAHRDTL